MAYIFPTSHHKCVQVRPMPTAEEIIGERTMPTPEPTAEEITEGLVVNDEQKNNELFWNGASAREHLKDMACEFEHAGQSQRHPEGILEVQAYSAIYLGEQAERIATALERILVALEGFTSDHARIAAFYADVDAEANAAEECGP